MRAARRTVLALLGVLMLLVHLLAMQQFETVIESRQALEPMPARLTVDFVRVMALSAPRPVAAAPAKLPRRQPAAPQNATAASAAASVPSSAAPGVPQDMPREQAREAQAESLAEHQSERLPPRSPDTSEAASSVAVASAASAPGEAGEIATAKAADPGPEWPLSTQLRYRLRGNYRGAVTGHAQVQWLRQGTRYQVHLDVAVGPSFAPLISRRMSSDGQLSAQGIRPQRYDEETRVLLASPRRVSVEFGAGQVRLADGRLVFSQASLQDSASQFVQLTWLLLTGRVQAQPGRRIDMPLALPRRVYDWAYEITGQETLDTPMGPLDAWHLQPLRDAQGGDLKSEVWLAPALQYLPVRLRIRQDENTYIDLMLEAAPLQAAP